MQPLCYKGVIEVDLLETKEEFQYWIRAPPCHLYISFSSFRVDLHKLLDTCGNNFDSQACIYSSLRFPIGSLIHAPVVYLTFLVLKHSVICL